MSIQFGSMNVENLHLKNQQNNHWILIGFASNLKSEHFVYGRNYIKKNQILTKISCKTSPTSFGQRKKFLTKNRNVTVVPFQKINFMESAKWWKFSKIKIYSSFSVLKKKRNGHTPGACHCKRIISAPHGAF